MAAVRGVVSRGRNALARCAAVAEAAPADASFMRAAIWEARDAFAHGEVPVGAVLVRNGAVIARARNRVEELRDASAHAEMLCMRAAAAGGVTWRLNALGPVTLYVTVEPCPMCLAAIHAFRVDRLVYGAPNDRMGAVEGLLRPSADADHPYHTVENLVERFDIEPYSDFHPNDQTL